MLQEMKCALWKVMWWGCGPVLAIISAPQTYVNALIAEVLAKTRDKAVGKIV